jgi:hypothetical protein
MIIVPELRQNSLEIQRRDQERVVDHDAGDGTSDHGRLVVGAALDVLGCSAPARLTATAPQASYRHVLDVHRAIAIEHCRFAQPDPIAPHPVTAASGTATPMR